MGPHPTALLTQKSESYCRARFFVGGKWFREVKDFNDFLGELGVIRVIRDLGDIRLIGFI